MSVCKAIILIQKLFKGDVYEWKHMQHTSLEYFNTTAQMLLFSLSKHLHSRFLFPTPALPPNQLFNLSDNSFLTFQSNF